MRDTMTCHPRLKFLLLAVLLAGAAACHSGKPPNAMAPPPNVPTPFPGAAVNEPPPVPRPPDLGGIPPQPAMTSTSLLPWNDKSLDVINGPDSPLKPVFFTYDSDDLDDAGRRVAAADAEVLRAYKTWVVTIEGHCDERGTAEYNLALGDRRALAVRNYLLSLGIEAERLRTVSYGKEFPFDTGHSEAAWAKNRRAHFMLTSK